MRIRFGLRLLLTLCLTGACGGPAPPPALSGPNLVLLVVDTLRADRLGCYGHARPTSPNLDRLAAGGFLFEDAQSTAPWTAPAFASLLTGLHPDAHGLRDFPEPARLSPELPTLASLLRARGYATAAFTEGGYAKADFGFDRGFDHYQRHPGDERSHASNLFFASRLEANVDRAIAWLEDMAPGPFFLLVHTYEPHYPYAPDQRWLEAIGSDLDLALEEAERVRAVAAWNAGLPLDESGWIVLARHLLHCDLGGGMALERRPELQAALAARGLLHPGDPAHPLMTFVGELYDAEIAAADFHLGRVLAALEGLGLEQDTVVVLASDHGESLGEHGELGHGLLLSDVVLRMALVIRAPRVGSPPRRLRGLASGVDLLPTALELLGVPTAGLVLQGRSLLPAMLGREEERPVYSHANTGVELRGAWHAIREGPWRYLLGPGGRGSLYQCEEDPAESRDVLARHPEVGLRLRERLEAQIAVDARLRERCPPLPPPSLRADPDFQGLGYVGREEKE